MTEPKIQGWYDANGFGVIGSVDHSQRAVTITPSGLLPANIEGNCYYVEANAGDDDNDGLSWDSAYATLAVALAASHANIAAGSSGWAARNTIFIKGDTLTEDLTKLAQKTTIVGCGSCDGTSPARILGHHVIDTGAYIGCRFVNVAFIGKAATAAPIITLVTQQAGAEFVNCMFLANTSTTTAITATAVTDLKILGSSFYGSWVSGFATAAISLGAGSGNRTIISDNLIENSAAKGILVDAGRTGGGSFIIRNQIYCHTIAVDDPSSTFYTIDNRGVSDANVGATTWNAAAAKGINNLFTSANGVYGYPVFTKDHYITVT